MIHTFQSYIVERPYKNAGCLVLNRYWVTAAEAFKAIETELVVSNWEILTAEVLQYFPVDGTYRVVWSLKG